MATHHGCFLEVWLDGVPLPDIKGRALSVDVEERCDGLSSCRLALDMAPTPDGDWDAIADRRFDLLRRVTIAFGVGEMDGPEPDEWVVVFDGYITAAEAVFGGGRVPDSALEITGLDASCLLHIEERTRSWSGQSDAEMVEQIYHQYGFRTEDDGRYQPPPIDRETPQRDLERAPLIQRGTDAEFIRMVARRNGFEHYVEPALEPVQESAEACPAMIGHFHLPRVSAEQGVPTQPALTLLPIETPSLIEFRARWDSQGPTEVRAAHIDERTRRIRSTTIDSPGFARHGERTRATILAERLPDILGSPQGIRAVGLQSADVPHDEQDLEGLAGARFAEADWLVTGSGVVQGARYPAVLRARRPVSLRGAGAMLDGEWYVRMARHRWLRDSDTRRYEIDVDLARNALNGVGG